MSVRTSIAKALAEKLKEITTANGYITDLYENAYPYLKFWDEISSYPSVYMSTGSETREYLPGNFTWAFLGLSIKVYTKGEEPAQLLEELLEDVEKCINANRVLTYDVSTGRQTTEILVNSIVTDEGLLAPYGVGEINISIQYQVL